MKKFICYIPKVIVKLIAMMFSPVWRLFTLVYRLAAFLLSYGLTGLSLVCVVSAAAEIIFGGGAMRMFGYLALAALFYAARWLFLRLVPVLLMAQDYIDMYASAPIRQKHYNDFYNNFYDYDDFSDYRHFSYS